ncbi:hypothetical protein NA78x_005044 [Anatilimnocola sp. NA78]|uniref:phosphorylase family protein n=1 Tax=Anatilimnocola sp. NA78 TaxID=3415683 RepID=UPI003CE57D2D
MDKPSEITPALDDLYRMVASIYEEKNSQRPPTSTFAHFVETCGMLTIIDRKKKRDEITIVDALCKSLGWFFPLLARLRVTSVEELVYRKYPYACPYCRLVPHSDKQCKTTKGTEATLNHDALIVKYQENQHRRPSGLNEWQKMFDLIYPREASALGSGRSSLGLLEEIGELAEAIRVFDKYPKYFAGEAADVFSYIMGVANEFQIKQEMEGGEFDFEKEFLLRYPGLCLQCGYESCVCPSVPESTVGRLAKELDLSPTELFCSDMTKHLNKGREFGANLLDGLGGLPSVAGRLPLDRGETNRALVLLCFKLADEVEKRDSSLAINLRQAAMKTAADTRAAGSRGQSSAYQDVVNLLGSVWPLLDLAAIPDDSSMSARVGKTLRATSCRIGIVTALPKEFAAMRAMLDEERDLSIAGDPNTYVLGSIPAPDNKGSHVVVVTMLKEMGNNSAAAAATHLLRSFPSVDEVVMVGIAGGIPNYENAGSHVRLGDIVISRGQGIVQYDNLKVGNSKIELRGSSDRPSSNMVGIINRLESERLMNKYPWDELIERGSKLELGLRPDQSLDVLYKWDGDVATRVDHPEIESDPRKGKPKLHYGKIGAANTLLKNTMLRDRVAKDCGVIAIEMEGSGIADAAWIAGKNYTIIRGICDYCDPKKNDHWQMYAAVVAAAYARVLISHLPLSNVGLEPSK